jgi:hypothetical protein
LVELIVGFGEPTPELVQVTCQAVTLLVQLTKIAGQPFDSPGQFQRRSGFRRALHNALTIAAKPGHWPTLAPGRPWDRPDSPQDSAGAFPGRHAGQLVRYQGRVSQGLADPLRRGAQVDTEGQAGHSGHRR